ncbi:hypothetical protein GL2_23050 [Microbulbifer sp. GL-2]|nr:hypothetical protein GL2_23050 [Microbulbifer sp. GL-2]
MDLILGIIFIAGYLAWSVLHFSQATSTVVAVVLGAASLPSGFHK